jgi:hypothetical protein
MAENYLKVGLNYNGLKKWSFEILKIYEKMIFGEKDNAWMNGRERAIHIY